MFSKKMHQKLPVFSKEGLEPSLECLVCGIQEAARDCEK